jgi:hypothetical protein
MPSLIATHYAHIYQRPAQGSAWLGVYRALHYSHRLTIAGGFDSASFSLDVKPAEAEYIYSYLIGCVVRIHVDDPINPIFEGYIDRITYRAGGQTLTRSLENMANRVNVVYYSADKASGTKTEQNAVANNTASQAIYGVKEVTIDGGIHRNDSDKTHKVLLRNTQLATRAWPQVSMTNASAGTGALIEIELRGLHVMAWDWSNFRITAASGLGTTEILSLAYFRLTASTASANAYLPPNASMLYVTGGGGVGNVQIQTNNNGNISLLSESGQTRLEFIQSIVEAGDGTNQYVFGITLPDPNTGLRYVYYRQANTTVQYQAYALRDTGRLRDLAGRLIPGWRVTPDAGVQLMDVLIGYNQLGDDPRIGYIQSVDYDADSGLVTFQTGDNATMEGVLQADRYFKAHGKIKKFGANLRQVL